MFIYENYYCRDIIKKIKHFSNNVEFDKIMNECQSIDSIADFDIFKNYVMQNIKNKAQDRVFTRWEFGAEGIHYGHREAFFEYAGVDSEIQRFIFPVFEHGADLRERVNKDIFESINHSFLFQSAYKNDIIHKERPWAPVYNIGPYILYAKNYYKNEEFLELKKKFGRTALLFPAHTFEGASVEFNKNKFVKEVLDKFKNNYDTILISVYWNDVDDPVYEIFAAEGAKLVSAGFRGDPNFIVRLRAIIELSDVVASNMTGSYIGYSQALNKPLYMFSDKAHFYSAEHVMSTENEKRYENTVDEIFDAFSSLTPTIEQSRKQRAIYEKFWGGEKFFKTKEEAKTIISLSSKLLKESWGTTKKFEKVIINLVNSDDRLDLNDEEYQLLREAIGK